MTIKRGAVHACIKHAIADRSFRHLSARTLTIREIDLDLIADRLIDDLATLAIKAKAMRPEQATSEDDGA